MLRFTTITILITILTPLPGWGQTLTSNMIETMGNNSLFTRWRPRYHFLAPAGWMNDPCGPLYDPASRLYHMHYQWHPHHANWGNISWGHATSHDLTTWTDVDHFPKDSIRAWSGVEAQSIGTTVATSHQHNPPRYNHLGIFSGTAQPVNLTGGVDGTLLAFYTSVSRLPFSWDAPYPAGAESQSLAYSTNGGVTWEEYAGNPVLSQPPGGWNITGWRDPFFHASAELDALLNYAEPHYYVIFGSGIGDVGPRMPLYSTPASNLTTWKFLGALWEPKGNSSFGDVFQTGSYGFQFEVPDFFNLGEHWFVSTGTQGGSTNFHKQNWVVWNEGTVSARKNGSVEFTPISGGASDWGILYAITSFNDTKNNRRIQIGWAWEDMNSFGTIQQGYQGALSLPRELFVLETPNLGRPETNMSGNAVYSQQNNGTYTARTLGARPAPDVIEGLRKGSKYMSYDMSNMTGKGNGKMTHMLSSNLSQTYELSIVINSTTGRTGVTIGASPDFEEYTSIYYDPASSSIVCERLHSSMIQEFLNTSYVGYFAPYRMSSGSEESIELHIFLDGSLLEVFANDRFAMTSRIYPSRMDSKGVGLYAAPGVEVEYGGAIEVWNGLANVWPTRPENCSSPLVFDTAAETNNYTWWSGNYKYLWRRMKRALLSALLGIHLRYK